MNRLFVKIFLGFWFTTLVVLAAAHFGGRYLETLNPDDRLPPWELRRAAHELLREAQRVARREDLSLEEWLESQQLPHELRFALFGPDRQPRAGEPDAALTRHAHSLGRERVRLLEEEDGQLYLGRILFQQGRPAMRMVVTIPRVERGSPALWLQRHFWLRALIAVLASGLLCYLLARLAVRPILSLQGATRALAGGALETRIAAPDQGGDEITELARDFNHMADRLQKTLEDQQQLLRDISHELRSPLGRIQAALALAERRLPKPSPELAQVARECERLNALIGELLVVPEQYLQLEDTVDLAALLHTVVEDNRLAARQAGCRLELEIPGRALLVRTHGDLLYRAFDNVLRNAIRHTAPGTAVTVHLAVEPRQLQVCIRDRGPGLAPQLLERIFLPFYQVQDAREHGSGYGLGLSIAQRAVQLHGGEISARNPPGDDPGLQVSIRLPAELITDNVD